MCNSCGCTCKEEQTHCEEHIEYKTVSADNIKDFDAEINSMLEAGWQMYGGHTVFGSTTVRGNSVVVHHYQTMLKVTFS